MRLVGTHLVDVSMSAHMRRDSLRGIGLEVEVLKRRAAWAGARCIVPVTRDEERGARREEILASVSSFAPRTSPLEP